MPTANEKHKYPMECMVKNRCGELQTQCDCIILISMKKAKGRAKA